MSDEHAVVEAVVNAAVDLRNAWADLRAHPSSAAVENCNDAAEKMDAAMGGIMARLRAAEAERDRLRALFDDAGEGQYNVLALIDHYQRDALDANDRLRAVRELLEQNGCDCDCEHYWEEHDDDCERCLACCVDAAIRGAG